MHAQMEAIKSILFNAQFLLNPLTLVVQGPISFVLDMYGPESFARCLETKSPFTVVS